MNFKWQGQPNVKEQHGTLTHFYVPTGHQSDIDTSSGKGCRDSDQDPVLSNPCFGSQKPQNHVDANRRHLDYYFGFYTCSHSAPLPYRPNTVRSKERECCFKWNGVDEGFYCLGRALLGAQSTR